MELLSFMFRLGVLFAIYGFIWGLIEIAIALLSAGRKRSLMEVYTIKALKYFFLVDVAFLFCLENTETNLIVMNQIIMAGLLLLTYFIGKLQNNQNRQQMFKMMSVSNGMSHIQSQFDIRAEIVVILLSVLVFIGFWFFPDLAANPVSIWFHESIVDIEDTPIFGFIFQVVGFFFLLSLIFKMSGAFGYLLSGQALRDVKNKPSSKSKDDFDQFTEVD
jgi:hypothetical protein